MFSSSTDMTLLHTQRRGVRRAGSRQARVGTQADKARQQAVHGRAFDCGSNNKASGKQKASQSNANAILVKERGRKEADNQL